MLQQICDETRNLGVLRNRNINKITRRNLSVIYLLTADLHRVTNVVVIAQLTFC
jgi:hypothetical protein